MAIKAIGVVGRTELSKVDPKEILVDERENYRQDYTHVKDLQASIEENGLQTPIELIKTPDNRLQLVSGYCRMRAIKNIIKNHPDAFPWIPATIHTKPLTQSQILLRNLASNEGKRPSPLEECEAYSRLVRWNIDPKEIAKKVGKSITHIKNILALQSATPETIQAIQNKEIPTTKAIKAIQQGQDQTQAIEEHQKQKQAKKEQRQAAKQPPAPVQSNLGFAVPTIPGLSLPPTDKTVNTENTPINKAKTHSGPKGFTLMDWIPDSIEQEYNTTKSQIQDKIAVQAEIDDLVDWLTAFRERI